MTRYFYYLAAAVALTNVLGGLRASAQAAARPPNIIFLMTDQQRWDALGVLNPAIKTPNLDRLARQGILFRQAVCQAPMCVPSRYALMLGLYPSQMKVLTNGDSLSDEQLPATPLPEILRKAGYQTAGFGKTPWRQPIPSTRGFEVRAIGEPREGAFPAGIGQGARPGVVRGPGLEGVSGRGHDPGRSRPGLSR